jgi:tRNA modification GTPase
LDNDTICAIATPSGRGGIGIVRISGPDAESIVKMFCGSLPRPRTAELHKFRNSEGEILDEGIALLFPAPNSFTGETVVELQGHGGTQVLHTVLKQALDYGARLARPGEFSERAFLNGKLDLLQAEAVADLIDASSAQAARSALRTLQGVFSAQIHQLNEQLTRIRVNVEAAIDFSDEDIDIMADHKVADAIEESLSTLDQLFTQAQQGALLQEGLNIVIAGKPNAGKSSLLNALAGNDLAIVTDIPGTTRDLLKQQLSLDGLPLHITDTAGLRISDDPIEQEGVRRAQQAIQDADLILLVIDIEELNNSEDTITDHLNQVMESIALDSNLGSQLLHRLSLIQNKIDLLPAYKPGQSSIPYQELNLPVFNISAKKGSGLQQLSNHLKTSCGFQSTGESAFIARERHLIALREAREVLFKAASGVSKRLPLELIAEDLRLGQQHLGSITGETSSDDLLGEIFASFCVGK